MTFGDLLGEASLLVCVGPGGVGKTTVAAAMGVVAATAGRRVLVLTIDPARRLADALGVSTLADDPVEVEVPGPGSLHAAMVETGSSYDRLVERLVDDAGLGARLRRNPMYAAFSRTLARSHAYVAMERLHDAMGDGRWDLIILDTPPTHNAIEILDAPRRLSGFLELSVVRWLLPGAARAGTGRFIHGGRAARAILRGLVGERLLDEMTEFFGLFARLRDTFSTRATRVERMLRAEGSGFVLVCDPTPGTMADAVILHDDLRARGIEPAAAVFNRSFEVLDPDDPRELVTEVSIELPDTLPAELRPVAVRLRDLRIRAATGNAASRAATQELDVHLRPTAARVAIPRMDGAAHSVDGLLSFRPFLLEDGD